MTHKDKNTANAFIEDANTKALRTFITGLNHRKGELLYAANPKTLPEAYARLQMIINDQQRIHIANTFNGKNERTGNSFRNPQFKNQDEFQINRDSGNSFRNPKFKSQNEFQLNRDVQNSKSVRRVIPMDVDGSSMNVNIDRPGNSKRFNPNFKREYSRQTEQPTSSEQKRKFQRINNVENNEAKTVPVHNDETPEDEQQSDDDNDSIVSASIFLEE